MKNPDSIENVGATVAPRQTQNADGSPDNTRRGSDVSAPATIREVPLRVVEDNEPTVGLSGQSVDPGEGPQAAGLVVMGMDNDADTRGLEDVGEVMFKGNKPDSLVDLSRQGGYSKYNMPTGGETRAEGGWPDGGLRGMADSEAVNRTGVDRDS